MNRRQILLGSGLVALGGAVSGVLALPPQGAKADSAIQLAQATKIYDDDRFLGESAAPITIVEFSSLTCPHCASFHKHTLPELKAAWFDSGKARMIYRHYPLDGLALRAAALADCFEGKRFFGFLDLLFRTQENWARDNDPLGVLKKLAKQAGMGEEQSEACLTDEAKMDKIFEKVAHARDTYEIQSTPSFVVGGEKIAGSKTFEQFDKILRDLASDG
jgi:protein-disulfide isomerase